MRALVVLAVLAAAAATSGRARADVWSDATGSVTASAVDEVYADGLKNGDDAAKLAQRRGIPPREIINDIDNAIRAYEAAAKVKPTAAEPYARIARLIESFWFEECDRATPSPADNSPFCDPWSKERAAQLIKAWDEFEARAPLDPRIEGCPDPGHSRCPLFERAIMHTKLATKEHLAAAARDYRKLIDRAPAGTDLGIVSNNLAETYMMLGDLDEAIAMYRQSLAYTSDVSTAFGLAVALDRDDEPTEAKNLITELGSEGFTQFAKQIRLGATFFVPKGEVYYYVALAHETFGDVDDAVAEWQAYIQSGAHPEYQPRARAHLALLRAQQKLAPKIIRPVPPRDPLDE